MICSVFCVGLYISTFNFFWGGVVCSLSVAVCFCHIILHTTKDSCVVNESHMSHDERQHACALCICLPPNYQMIKLQFTILPPKRQLE